MKVSICIPVYQNELILPKTMPAVFSAAVAYGKDKTEIVVSNDNSTDNSLSVLQELKKKSPVPFTILTHDTSFRGFARNVNRTVRAATGDIIILLGTDVAPEKNFISQLIPHFDNEKIFAVGCVNHSDEDTDTTLRGRAIGYWKRGFIFHKHGEMINTHTFWADCGSSAFRKSIWDTIGGLQELYNPFYWEDVDLSYRAQKRGYLIELEPKAVVTHTHTIGTIKKTAKSDFVKQTSYRNQFFMVWLNVTDTDLLLQHVLWLPYHILTAIKGKNWLFIRGFLLAILSLPRVLHERSNQMKYYRVSDKKILSVFAHEL